MASLKMFNSIFLEWSIIMAGITLSIIALLVPPSHSFTSMVGHSPILTSPGHPYPLGPLFQLATNNNDHDLSPQDDRRHYLKKALIGVVSPIVTMTTNISSSNGAPVSDVGTTSSIHTFQAGKSRSEEYKVRKRTTEWMEELSGTQFSVLRKGGTERQRASILEKETRQGIFICAGCKEPLFASSHKFDSGTGWPSFDTPIDNDAIEIEEIGWLQDGAEVRCRTCGGHLGDVFGDGWRYAGSKTGKRYCINGAALVFRPADGGKELRGDIPPPNKVIQYESSMRRDDA